MRGRRRFLCGCEPYPMAVTRWTALSALALCAAPMQANAQTVLNVWAPDSNRTDAHNVDGVEVRQL